MVHGQVAITLCHRIEGPTLFFHAAVTELLVQQPGSGLVVYVFTVGDRMDGASQACEAEITQAIHTDVVRDLLDAPACCDEFFLLWDVDAEVAGMAQRR